MSKWEKLASDSVIKKTIKSLKANNIEALVVENGEQAKKKVLELLPKGAEVMDMSSKTLESIGVLKEISESGKYDAVKPKLMKLDRETQGTEMQKMGSAPEWAIGSVHAVTQDGHVVIASMSGSQLPAYAYGSSHVIWVVGTQKIVKDIHAGIDRVYEHTLPLESERVKEAYGMPESAVKKLLIVNGEGMPGRSTLIFVKEKLGF